MFRLFLSIVDVLEFHSFDDDLLNNELYLFFNYRVGLYVPLLSIFDDSFLSNKLSLVFPSFGFLFNDIFLSSALLFWMNPCYFSY